MPPKHTPLVELCDIQIGRTPARAEPRFWGIGHPWVSISDMSGTEIIQATKEAITDEAVKACNCKLVEPGTLLLSFKLSVGKLAFAGVPLYTNEAIAALSIKHPLRLDPRYLFHTLSQLDLQRGTDRAVMGLTLNTDKLERLPIPEFCIETQRRIAALLDKAGAIRRKRRDALKLAEELLRSAFLDLFGDPVTNSKGWPLEPIEKIAKVTTGNTPPRENPDYYGNYIEWIKSDNINTPSHYLTMAAEGLSEAGLKVGRSAGPGSTLITCIAGSPSCIGNAALADRMVAFNQQINALTPLEGIESEFLYANVLFSKAKIQAASTQGMKGMVSKGALEQVRFIAPPPPIRQRFANLFRRVMATTHRLEKAAGESEQLFKSLSARAFNSELATT
jgi:type I restriction enzyme, S subunit